MRRDLVVIAVVALPLLGVACDRRAPAPPAAAAAVVPVSVVKPERRAVKRAVDQPGTVQAFDETAVFAKIPGFVAALADDPDK